MADAFDPYEAWLGIAPHEQPPDYYRLLGITRFEKNARAISQGTRERLQTLESHLRGPQGEAAKRLIAEVNAARVCLLNETRRTSYDRLLLQRVAMSVVEEEAGAAPVRITAEQFLELLRQRDLAPPDLLTGIRQEIVAARQHVTASQVAQLLIDKGLLTKAMARRLLSIGSQEAAEDAGRPASSSRPWPGAGSGAEIGTDPAELGLAPLAEDPQAAAPPPQPLRQTPPKPIEVPRATTPESAVHEGAPRAPRAADGGAARVAEIVLPPVVKDAGRDAKRNASLAGGGERKRADPAAARKAAKVSESGSLLDEVALPPPADAAVLEAMPTDAAHRDAGPGQSRAKGPGRWILWTCVAIVILAAACGALLFVFPFGPGAAELLARADRDFAAERFSQARITYAELLRRFPANAAAEHIRVRAALATVGEHLVPRADWAAALQAAQETLPAVSDLARADDESLARLSVWLSAMIPSLIKDATSQPNEASVTRAQAAVRLARQLLPASQWAKLNLAAQQVALTETARRLTAESHLAELRKRLNTAGSEDGLDGLFAALEDLRRAFPEVADKPAVADLGNALSGAAARRIVWRAVDKPAIAEVSASEVSAAIAAYTQPIVGRSAVRTVWPVVSETSLFAVDAADGRLVWRRDRAVAGGDHRQGEMPWTTAPAIVGDDWVMLEPATGRLERIDARTGALRWRANLAEACCGPAVVAEQEIFVAACGGHLWRIDLESGAARGYWAIGQSLASPPLVDAAARRAYQITANGVLLVLGLEERRASQAMALGLGDGEFRFPPAIAAGCVVVFRDIAPRSTRIDFLVPRPPGGADWTLVAGPGIDGRLDAPPPVSGESVLLATDTGDAVVVSFRSAVNARREASVTWLRRPSGNELGPSRPLVPTYAWMDAPDRGWIADVGLSRFTLAPQPQVARLPASRVEVAAAPLGAEPPLLRWTARAASGVAVTGVNGIGSAALGVGGAAGESAAAASSVSDGAAREANAGRPFVWRTRLACPLTASPWMTRGAQTAAASSLGAVLDLAPAKTGSSLARLAPAVGMPPDFTAVRALDFAARGAVLIGGRGARGWVFTPIDDRAAGRWVNAPAPLACEPAAVGPWLVAPLVGKRVAVVDPASGELLAFVYAAPQDQGSAVAGGRPSVEASGNPPTVDGVMSTGTAAEWAVAVALSESETALIDALGEIELWRIEAAPSPDLASAVRCTSTARASLGVSPAARPAVFGGRLWVVDSVGRMCVFSRDLRPAPLSESLPTIAAGPWAVGDRLFAASQDGSLLCLTAEGARVWQSGLGGQTIVGEPWGEKDRLWFATQEGRLFSVDRSSGETKATIDAKTILGSGPCVDAGSLLVATADGTVLRFALPH